VSAWRWFYDEFEETRGKGEGQNPAHAAVVSHVLHLVGKILGRARVKMVQPLEPWMLKRMLFCLRADDVYGATVALVLSHGLCIGERAGAWFIRDHGHCGYTPLGEIVHRIYLKTDRLQARLRRELHAQRGARFARGACPSAGLTAARRPQEGSTKGVPHREACRNKGKETCDGVATVMVDGEEYFDGENYCPGCGVRHLQNVLLKVHGLTAEDLEGVPLFADYTLLKDLQAGATLVKAEEDSQVGRIKLQRGVKVISAEEERNGVMYRGEEVTVPVSPDADEDVAAEDDMAHLVALPVASGDAAQVGARAGEAAGQREEADAFVTDQVTVDAGYAAAADAEAARAAAMAADGGGAADEAEDDEEGSDGGAGPAGDTEKKRYRIKGMYFEMPGKGLAVHAWPTVRSARGCERCASGLT
jgi:hypothetical protein